MEGLEISENKFWVYNLKLIGLEKKSQLHLRGKTGKTGLTGNEFFISTGMPKN